MVFGIAEYEMSFHFYIYLTLSLLVDLVFLHISIYADEKRIMSLSCHSVYMLACSFSSAVEPTWTNFEGCFIITLDPADLFTSQNILPACHKCH